MKARQGTPRRRLRIAALALCTLFGVSLPALLTLAATPPTSAAVLRSRAPASRPAGSQREGHAADAGIAAQDTARSRFRDVFGGLELTGHGTHVVVYLTRLSPAAERAIRGGAPADEFTFRKVSHSAAFLVALQHRITRDWGALRADGIRLVNWGPGFGRENVTVLHLTPAKARLLDQRYGAASLSLHTTSQPSLGIPVNFR